MNTNTMELNLNEMEMVNGCGHDLDYKITAIGVSAGMGAISGGISLGSIGTLVPGIGTVVGGTVGAVVGGAIAGGAMAIKVFFFDD